MCSILAEKKKREVWVDYQGVPQNTKKRFIAGKRLSSKRVKGGMAYNFRNLFYVRDQEGR